MSIYKNVKLCIFYITIDCKTFVMGTLTMNKEKNKRPQNAYTIIMLLTIINYSMLYLSYCIIVSYIIMLIGR